MHNAFKEVNQRPFPIPSSPWVMTQEWSNLAMLHWPVKDAVIEASIPEQLELDLFNGTAWMTFVLFRAENSRLRLLPRFPYVHSFLELNVRTYVTYKGIPGIYFFNLDADKWPVVLGARIGALLPYRHAKMSFRKEGPAYFFESEHQPEKLKGYYRPASEPFLPSPNSLDFWLLERYCYWTANEKSVFRGVIHHDRWRVATAESMIEENSMAPFVPRSAFQAKPLVHYTSYKKVFAWPVKAIK